MSEACPCCGAEQPDRVERHGLIVQRDPDAVYWRGVRQRLTPAEIRTLYLLAQRGRSSYLALEFFTSREETVANAVKVRACRLRAWLRRLDPRFDLRCERGWGYVLEFAE